jgi:hypothetical protein
MQHRFRPSTISLPLVMALFLPLAACSDSGGGSSGPVSVGADTPGGVYTALSMDVALTVTGGDDPVIYYTTDMSEPTVTSTLYAGPITLTDTTILKFVGVDTKGRESEVGIEAYTRAPSVVAQQLAASGHGDLLGEPFRHWDEDGEVQTSCARCHTGPGFGDYARDGIVGAAAPLPLGLHCDTCHDPVAVTLYEDLAKYPNLEPVEFPSTSTASLNGNSNMCMTCHQGRQSGLDIDEAIANLPGGPYTFINVHYYAAAASYFGGETKGGYQYAGLEYAGRNPFPSHEAQQQTCVGCHMRGANKDHTFEPEVSDCTTCHTGTSFETLSGSPGANYTALVTTREELLEEIQDYATDVLGEQIAYGDGYPYFFFDLNGNALADAEESSYGNRYDAFDEALLKAAYNYQVVAKDPAGFIHNGTYLRQLIQDSVEDLGGAVSIPAPGRAGFDLANASKSEQWHVSGHSHSTAEAFRHWDEDGEVPASCAKCHSSPGFADYALDGTVDDAAPLGSLVGCSACHTNTDLYSDPSTRHDDLLVHTALEPVLFPSGVTQTLGDNSNLCMTCHQGRASGVSVEAPTANTVVQGPADYDSYDFINRHYFAAASIYFGTDVTAAWENPGQTYLGRNTFAGHGGGIGNCLECHAGGTGNHSFEVSLDRCTLCHLGITEFEELGLPDGMLDVDYDGDALGESFQDEIDGMAATLLAGIYAYADDTGPIGLPQASAVVYFAGAYPYWFHDLNADGIADPDETNYGNRYGDFDLTLLRAAFNYHAAQDPCSDMHNYKYVLQTVYDAADMLDDLMVNQTVPGSRP